MVTVGRQSGAPGSLALGQVSWWDDSFLLGHETAPSGGSTASLRSGVFEALLEALFVGLLVS